MDKIRILIADDHPTFREGLARIIREQNDMDVVAEAGDGQEAVELATQFHPDVAILDIAMPNLDGVHATEAIKAACPNTAILILSAYRHDPYILGAIKAGASGYLLKETRVRELISAIRSLHAGETVLDSDVAKKVFNKLGHSTSIDSRIPQELHEREMEILKLVAKGMGNKEVASELSISVRTVQAHLVNIYNKLNVSSRTEALVRALKEGWITTDELP